MKRLAILLLCVTFCFTGCGGYGEVSPKAYEIATSLYNVSNRKMADRLELVSEQITTARENDEISEGEEKWLGSIVDKAEDENWEQAMKAARRMMEDQVTKYPIQFTSFLHQYPKSP